MRLAPPVSAKEPLTSNVGAVVEVAVLLDEHRGKAVIVHPSVRKPPAFKSDKTAGLETLASTGWATNPEPRGVTHKPQSHDPPATDTPADKV